MRRPCGARPMYCRDDMCPIHLEYERRVVSKASPTHDEIFLPLVHYPRIHSRTLIFRIVIWKPSLCSLLNSHKHDLCLDNLTFARDLPSLMM